MRSLRHIVKASVCIILLIGAFLSLLPLFWMISTSLKTVGEIFKYPPSLLPSKFYWDNYITAFNSAPWIRYFLNTALYTFCTVAGVLLTSVMSGYAFSKLEWKGRNATFIAYLGTMMVPSQVTIIPVFMILSKLGWVNSYAGLIIPGLTSAFGCFLMRQFMVGLPDELVEAGLIDGASHYRILVQIVLPLVKPSLATLGVFTFMGAWNAFFWPLIVTNSDKYYTVQIGLSAFQGLYGNVDWGSMMAAATMVSIPVLIAFLFTQQYFIEGITMSGIKG